jgi:hypothetical protein
MQREDRTDILYYTTHIPPTLLTSVDPFLLRALCLRHVSYSSPTVFRRQYHAHVACLLCHESSAQMPGELRIYSPVGRAWSQRS